MGRRKNYSTTARMIQARIDNDRAFCVFFDLLKTMYMAKNEWTAEGIFDTVDTRILEEILFYDGRATIFKENLSGKIFVLPFIGGKIRGVYAKEKPTRVTSACFSQEVNDNNSVVIYDKMSRYGGNLSNQIIPPMFTVAYYAEQLSNISRAMDVNLSGLRTPLIFSGDEKQKLTIENLMAQYDSNQEFIFMADRNNKAVSDPVPVNVISTGVPFFADRFQSLFTQKWQEAMTAIGIQNANVEKKERLLVDEINSNNAQVSAITYSQLEARQTGAESCMKLFAKNPEDVFAVTLSEAIIEPMSDMNDFDSFGGAERVPDNNNGGEEDGTVHN